MTLLKDSPTPDCRLLALVLFSILLQPVLAYPPAPAVTISGMVRDEYGWVVDSPGAEVVIKADGREIARRPISSNLKFHENYRVMVAVDTALTEKPYRREALSKQGNFIIEVHIAGLVFHPIETLLIPELGQEGGREAVPIEEAGESIHLDLTLGADEDADGLPDAWERWQLRNAGINDPDGLGLLRPDGDADGDGISDLDEFYAGSSAFRKDSGLKLKVVDIKPGEVIEFEYSGHESKAYILEGSTTGDTWVSVPVAVGHPDAPPTFAWISPLTAPEKLFVPTPAASRARIFRLRTR